MKNNYLFLLLIFICSSLSGQSICIESNSFEKWIDETEEIAKGAKLPKNTFLFPENGSPAIRLLIAFFSSPEPGTAGYEPFWKQVKLGIERDSLLVKSGKYALRMTVDKGFSASDFLSVDECKKIPTSITFSYRHVGKGKDTLNFSFFQGKKDDSLPQTQEELKKFASYAVTSVISQVDDATYKTITIPIIKNFIDTSATVLSSYFLYLGDDAFLNGGGKSAFVIDDIMFNSMPSGVNENNIHATKIYPNPARNIMTLETTNHDIEQVVILGATGQIIKKILGNTTQIDLEGIPSGLHIIHISHANNETEILRFIKE